MRIINTFLYDNKTENIASITRAGISAVLQLRRGEPLYLAWGSMSKHSSAINGK